MVGITSPHTLLPHDSSAHALDSAGTSRPPGWCCWLASLLFHAALVVLLGITLHIAPRGNSGEHVRSVGVVLKQHSTEQGDYFEGESDLSHDNAAAQSQSTASGSLLDDALPGAAQQALPASLDALGLGNPEGGGVTGAGGLLDSIGGSKLPSRGRGKAGVFNTFGEGYKFVYVFDRSGSMGGSGYNALNLAKTELLASLQSLGDLHQFQIIFYNEHPSLFPGAGQSGRLVFANAANKVQATKFVRGITADGGTQHEDALLMALNLRPDVIFFLTDADRPELNPGQLQKIAARNRGGAVINAIEFGIGPSLGDENFLMRLARQNGGSYSYVDIVAAAK